MPDSFNNGFQESHERGGLHDEEMLTSEKWQAIIDNEASYDDQFLYAVKTTGIFCKPSCKSRIPKKENVRIFPNVE